VNEPYSNPGTSSFTPVPPAPCHELHKPPRRSFFFWLTALVGSLASLLAGVPVVGYFVTVRRREIEWVPLGPVDGFTIGETRMVTFDNPMRQPWDGVVSHTGVYVRRETPGEEGAERFMVLAINCAHLGCPVSWFPQSGLFMCPCHGGVYYADGSYASGPPPRGMFHAVWRVTDSGLEIQAPHYPTLQDTLTGKSETT
jgi:menaquinol-cytochrome c reductase iron-sulfur subunit